MKKQQDKRWYRVTMYCDAQALEAVSNFLFEKGASGIEEQETGIIGYFNGISNRTTFKKALRKYIDHLKVLGFAVGDFIIAEQPVEDWSAGWREYFQPIRVTSGLVVKPPWASWNGPEKIVINIYPQMAFGTGSHDTTRLCLALLEKYMQMNHTVLDVGSGSGILSIAAVKLGGRCVAVEIDESALQNCRDNVELNSVSDRIEILQGSIDIVSKQSFDLILANINQHVLLDLLPGMIDLSHSETKWILSGLLIPEQEIIIQKLNTLNRRVLEIRTSGEWIGLVASKNQ